MTDQLIDTADLLDLDRVTFAVLVELLQTHLTDAVRRTQRDLVQTLAGLIVGEHAHRRRVDSARRRRRRRRADDPHERRLPEPAIDAAAP